MATIYDTTPAGGILTDGLQGCDVTDEAYTVAVQCARRLGEDVILDDDDGSWLVHPDGSSVEYAWDDDTGDRERDLHADQP